MFLGVIIYTKYLAVLSYLIFSLLVAFFFIVLHGSAFTTELYVSFTFLR